MLFQRGVAEPRLNGSWLPYFSRHYKRSLDNK